MKLINIGLKFGQKKGLNAKRKRLLQIFGDIVNFLDDQSIDQIIINQDFSFGDRQLAFVLSKVYDHLLKEQEEV